MRQYRLCWHWCLFLTGQFGRRRPNLSDRVATSYSLEISQAPAKLTTEYESIKNNICLQGASLSARPLRQAFSIKEACINVQRIRGQRGKYEGAGLSVCCFVEMTIR